MQIYVGPKQAPELIEAVTTAGGEVVEDPALAQAIVWYGGSPQEFAAIDHDRISWVQLQSAGVEGWFAANAFSDRKLFTSAVGSYAETVAEQALALMLAGARRLHELARQRTWTTITAGSLFGSTVGIVGCGGIGRSLIDLLAPFRARVLAITRSGTHVPGATETVTPDHLDDVLTASDFVVIGAPATPRTRHLIGMRELKLMRQNAWLINVARGSLIDTDALVDALRTAEIGGAGLDVTEPEPLPDDHPLWAEPNALVSPHSANPLYLLVPRLAQRVHDNVRHYLAGEPLEGVIDVSRGY